MIPTILLSGKGKTIEKMKKKISSCQGLSGKAADKGET